jgi:hypothetical protein
MSLDNLFSKEINFGEFVGGNSGTNALVRADWIFDT